MTSRSFPGRLERFGAVDSTQQIVREWLEAGEPEVEIAVADEQTAGRGRQGRTWTAPPGAALLMSIGFRPTNLPLRRGWRLAATVSLAMADAAEEVAGLPDHAIWLKWPNDLYTANASGEPRKLAGVLGETDGLGGPDPRAVIGIGINADWPAETFPPELASTMTSLREASHGRSIDPAHLLDAFLSRLEVRVEAMRGGRFDLADWTERQLTTGREVELERPDGTRDQRRVLGVDADSGGLVVEDTASSTGERVVHVGEVRRVRLDGGAQVRV
jgi:BirA family biotin operon repressor/biotin-[acetyl-CoA-carboxylase] ligase